MKRVDQILKYLSGELGPAEQASMEEAMAADPEFKREFREISMAWNAASRELQRRDEAAFRQSLENAMQEKPAGSGHRQKPHGYRWLLPFAAGLALIIALRFFGAGPEERIVSPYREGRDPLIENLGQRGRGDLDQALLLFRQKNREALYQYSKKVLEEEGKQPAGMMILHLLAAMETGREEAALALCDAENAGGSSIELQALVWYRSLALLDAGKKEEAIIELEALVPLGGPYAGDAHKLHKLLTK